MVPLDDDTVALIDRIVEHRSPGRPLRHPKSGRLVEFLFTHHGRRVSRRHAARRAAARRRGRRGRAGRSPPTPPHFCHRPGQSGCSLQSLMAMLGHVSAEMSLRYGRLFDATVRADYEKALTLAKDRLGPVLPERDPGRPQHRLAQRPAHQGPTRWGLLRAHPRPGHPAPTRTSASTARTSAPTPPSSRRCLPNGPTPSRSWPTPRPAAGATKPPGTVG